MTSKLRLWLGLVVALLGGLFIGWIDESMRWSDNARVGFCLVVFAAAGVFIARQKPWLVALLVAIWIPLMPPSEILHWKPWLALIPALISAYITHLAIDRSDLVL